ncbi:MULTISPECIES: hypothetical protein [unclassified Herbaspirillum]|uniref:hypothetical protein n=1 Tax=unclassified Herbaspirillum TaxID=2624150 RepID=UPI00116DECA2|nr:MULTISPECIES: hypothetical protein [unclassified Herbaspirillum]MBB5390926.1 hypothetical protein [Herbaspirillum sp. SJZ102]TQK06449.1 hypothetical protein FB599_2603 [Herbaspirillum sp. SJZ130]TQK12073.1 hypothetical protein FB598_2016 [Herbaspirillum sp. SJZ106]TWC64599.1 hypothetical protein FB597_10891 [Herbaspirillum sp. SJZ099]
MPINSVSSSHNASAHAAQPQPAKKSGVSFADLMVASQPVAQPTNTVASSASTSQVNKA